MSENERVVYDPYQPPAAPVIKSDPEEEDGFRSLALVFVLCVLTLGLYGTYWLWDRRNFLQKRQVFVRVGPATLGLLLVLDVAVIATGLAPSLAGIANLIGIADAIVRLVALFGMRDALNAWAASLGERGPRSGAGTFFFGVLYLQHAMNQIARRGTRAAT
jgi:hypothetical protein